ncbi:MAG: hypothetical protein JJ916_12480 [Phycisphaerales bacterium]|nr:hypothetical protein [Phycisphaerales bacterium]
MRRKNLLLTLWLIAPIAVFAGLYALIFVTQDKEKLMADAKPIGAGAGDTGDANAIGQWLAGRDPDAVSLATKAKRERLMISPYDWPGGVELSIPAAAMQGEPERVYLTLIYEEAGRFGSSPMRLDEDRSVYRAVISSEQLGRGKRFVIAGSLPSSEGGGYVDENSSALRVLTMSPVLPPSDADVSEPLAVHLPIDTVYDGPQP